MKLIKGIGDLFKDGFLMIVGFIVCAVVIFIFGFVHDYILVPIIILGFVMVGCIWVYWFIRWSIRKLKRF